MHIHVNFITLIKLNKLTTQSHYPDADLIRPLSILVMPYVSLVSDKYQLCESLIWFATQSLKLPHMKLVLWSIRPLSRASNENWERKKTLITNAERTLKLEPATPLHTLVWGIATRGTWPDWKATSGCCWGKGAYVAWSWKLDNPFHSLKGTVVNKHKEKAFQDIQCLALTNLTELIQKVDNNW